MSLDLSPRSGVADPGDRVIRHALLEASLLLRNGEQLLLSLVIPLGLLVAGMLFGERFGLDPRAFPASVIALALWSTSFTSLAINTAFERRNGVLERLAATPLTRTDLVAGKAVATTAIALGQVAIIAGVAFALGWRPVADPGQVALAVLASVFSLITFACFALALAGRLRAEATLAVANLIYLVVAAGGALVLPLSAYPTFLQLPLLLLPSGALGESLRAAATGGFQPFLVVIAAAWAALALAVARKAFRWTS